MSEKKQPDIRFKGFSGDWQQKLLCECGDTYTGLSGKSKVDFGHGEGKYVTYMNVFSNVIADSSLLESIEIDKRQNEVKYGDVFFTTSSETPDEVGMSSVWTKHIDNIYLNSFCFGYRPSERFDNNYLAYMLRSKYTREKIAFLAQGISRYNISKTKVMDIAIPLPVYKEQTKIGGLLKNLDNLIALNQSKYDKLVSMKKACLEKMFPKDGADTPEIRFKGFSGKWSEFKIGELTDVKSAARVHKNEWVAVGVPFFRSSDVVSAYKGVKNQKAYISYELFEELSKVSGRLKEKDILITGGGSIGIPYLVPNNKPLYSKDADLIWIKSSKHFISEYLYIFFATPYFKQYIKSISHVGTIAHYTIEQVKDTLIYLPEIEEQAQIGNYFKNLDNLITLRKTKLNKLKNIKKALLEKMFI